ncbi:MAG: SDR family NAD(P)-dependent oxidoreductase [Magnetococcales bacterium]|nr:SDR family NAD(P)-dependent oxidoreductase [Magnetococcales bacterium]
MLLKDRIILTTGAGSGIGRAVALAFAREGAFVLLLGRRSKTLTPVYDAIVAAGGQASIVPLDLETQLQRVPEVVQKIQERFGRLDGLLHAAAALGGLTPLALYDPVTWEKVMRINLTAPFFLTQQLLPLLRKSDNASVIQVISGVGRQGRAFWGAYAASKAGLLNLTQTWAQELVNTPVRINAVDPGPTATAMRATAFPGENPADLPPPEAIAPVFLYLASPHSHERGECLEARQWREWHPPAEISAEISAP